MRKEDIVGAILWYVEAKNIAIKNALLIRCPLSVEQQKDLRIYYSQYLANLLAFTEILATDYRGKDGCTNQRYRSLLFNALDFDGSSGGENNYSYLRELRNSVIHRGADISAAAHIAENGFPMLIAEQQVSSQNGRKISKSFGFYLVEMLVKADSAICAATLEHLINEGVFEIDIDEAGLMNDAQSFIRSSVAIPDFIKQLATPLLAKMDFVSLIKSRNEELTHLLQKNSLQEIIEKHQIPLII